MLRICTSVFGYILSIICLNFGSNIYANHASAKPLRLPTLERPRVQNRFQPRVHRMSAYVQAGVHIRDDYYDSLGGGASVEYFFTDQWGVGLNYYLLSTTFSDEAETLRDGYGLVPDARPQDSHLTLSALWGLGYGKMLTLGEVVHFDPIFSAHIGVASAEARTLPTLKLAFSPTFLLKYSLSVRLDLGLTIQMESRSRGWVLTSGFMPMISLGWGKQVWFATPPKQ